MITIGVFDGIHQGHKKLIAACVDEAAARDLPAVLVTFDQHPQALLNPDHAPTTLTSLSYRSYLAGKLGIDVVVVLPFTRELASMHAEDFIQDILLDHLHAEHIVIGKNFRFGAKAAGNWELLAQQAPQRGFTTQTVELLGDNAHIYSATYARELIHHGDVRGAAEVLGRYHRLEGIVIHGQARGRELGFPTANIAYPLHSAVPADGVYAAYTTVTSPRFDLKSTHREVVSAARRAPQVFDTAIETGKRYPSAVSVGTNPTFGGDDRHVEVFILGASGNLYGQDVTVDFVDYIRGQVAFSGIDSLIEQVSDDTTKVKQILEGT